MNEIFNNLFQTHLSNVSLSNETHKFEDILMSDQNTFHMILECINREVCVCTNNLNCLSCMSTANGTNALTVNNFIQTVRETITKCEKQSEQMSLNGVNDVIDVKCVSDLLLCCEREEEEKLRVKVCLADKAVDRILSGLVQNTITNTSKAIKLQNKPLKLSAEDL